MPTVARIIRQNGEEIIGNEAFADAGKALNWVRRTAGHYDTAFLRDSRGETEYRSNGRNWGPVRNEYGA